MATDVGTDGGWPWCGICGRKYPPDEHHRCTKTAVRRKNRAQTDASRRGIDAAHARAEDGAVFYDERCKGFGERLSDAFEMLDDGDSGGDDD